MRVAILDEPSDDWDRFATGQAQASLGHASAWGGVMRRSYRLKPWYLEARDAASELQGVLSLVRFRSLSGQRRLISLPFLDSSGILSSDPSARDALLEAGRDLARRAGAEALELREVPPDPAEAGPQQRVGMLLPLADSAEAQWGALRGETRNQTRKARKEGLTIAAGSAGQLRRSFYEVFRQNMRDLGSPVHSQRFFATMEEAFQDRLRYIVTSLGGRPVGGLVAIEFGSAVCVPWASALRAERRRCPNNLIYWEALCWAIERGAREFDFGRSEPGGGTHRFKRGWGAREHPLRWSLVAPGGGALPLRRSGDSPLLRRCSRLWTRLPVAWSSALGPPLRRFLSE